MRKFLKCKLNETGKNTSAMRGYLPSSSSQYLTVLHYNIFWQSDSKTNVHVLQFDESGKVSLKKIITLIVLTSRLFCEKLYSTLKCKVNIQRNLFSRNARNRFSTKSNLGGNFAQESNSVYHPERDRKVR